LWAPFFVKSFRLDPEFYVHKGIKEVMATGIKDKVPNLQNANLLMLYGDRDSRVPKSLIHETVGEIRETHKGKEGFDWKYAILPDTKHDINDAFISETMEWTKKWMLTNSTTTEAKVLASL
jgi:hypothetical protein